MKENQFSIGVDYGTNSVRAVVARLADGAIVSESVFNYPSGTDGILLDPRDPNLARQNPADYVEGFLTSVGNAVRQAKEQTPGFSAENVVGIGVDTTGSTPIPVDASGTPLAMKPEFKDELAAQAWLWKDHTSIAEAEEITEWAKNRPEGFLAKCGGTYSSEWYWAKILHCVRTSPNVAEAAASWVELADFIPAWLTGNLDPGTMPRGICAAGHKALYHEQWGGLPSEDALRSLDERLVRFRYTTKAVPVNHAAGTLTEEIARKTGLPAGISVAVGAFDCHLGAIGSGVKPGTLVKTIGTSTCDIMVSPLSNPIADIPGLCGIVPESVLPEMYGLEAGQSAVGDIFNWFVKHVVSGDDSAHAALTEEARKLKPGASGLLALDWNNGNRTVLVDQNLTGLILGQTLHTTAAEIYRALIEATAYGALTIINRFVEYGVDVKEVVCCGGIAEKNPLVMQICADIFNRPVKISRCSQTCALGSAIAGAVVGGAFEDFASAVDCMTGVKENVYVPNPESAAVYQKLYGLYVQLHDAFGKTGKNPSLENVMKDLIAIRQASR